MLAELQNIYHMLCQKAKGTCSDSDMQKVSLCSRTARANSHWLGQKHQQQHNHTGRTVA